MTPDDFVRSLTIDGELQPQDCLIDKYRTVKTAEVSYVCSYDVIGRVLTSCVESCHFDVSKIRHLDNRGTVFISITLQWNDFSSLES